MKNHKNIFLLICFIISGILNYSCQKNNSFTGKNIIVTAPQNYNHRLSKIINKAGAKAIPMPVINISLMDDKSEIDKVLKDIKSYKWIVLPSRNAIISFFSRAEEININNSELNKTTYCAIGKDIEYLKSFSVDSILTPCEPSPQGIVESLKSQSPINSNIAVFVPLVIGLPEPNVVPDFINNLKKIGLNVKRINAYVTSLNNIESYKKEITSIKKGEIDLIAFTSSAEIEAIIYMVGGVKHLSKTPIACFGPYTAGNAKRLGLKPCFVSKDYSSFEGYVNSMKEYFNKTNSVSR